uniref:Density-regulated protein n=1 Tax=Ciona intestinalis TaxID=7719 RepID=H2Y013_CIOIN|nr:density-regulated protein-like [Ciona intestinalis]|eukprot:XP_002126234.1 density-regulated protein-like [Ciona intestinalis]
MSEETESQLDNVQDNEDDLITTEEKSVSYPLKVIYCPECSLPLEYCEFMPEAVLAKCREWREKNLDVLEQEGVEMSSLTLDEPSGDKKRQKRGGRGNLKAKQKKEPEVVRIAKIPRGKRKFMTRVQGLATFDVNLKKASKLFAQKFSCGSSVSAADEILIQGDVTDDLIILIVDTWNEIDEDHIEDLGEVKR